MKKVLLLLALAGLSYSAQRTVVTKVAKPDTLITVKCDTTKTVVFDTVKVTTVFEDTSYSVKKDTTLIKASKPKAKK